MQSERSTVTGENYKVYDTVFSIPVTGENYKVYDTVFSIPVTVYDILQIPVYGATHMYTEK